MPRWEKDSVVWSMFWQGTLGTGRVTVLSLCRTRRKIGSLESSWSSGCIQFSTTTLFKIGCPTELIRVKSYQVLVDFCFT